MITEAFCASSRPLSRRLTRPCSNQATSWGKIGSPLMGMRTSHGCRWKPARIAHAHRDSALRHPSSGATAGGGPDAASTMSLTSSSLALTYRYRDMVEAPSSAATRPMDIRGTAILAGHIAASVARNTVSTVLVFGVACLIGFRPHAGPAGWLAAAGVLLLFILAMSWLAAAFGLAVKTPEAANGFMFVVAFLPYASSAFVPVATMPSWIRGFASHQPVTPATETIRGLLLGTPVGARPWLALAWCGGILALAVAASGWLFRRRTA